MLVIERRVGEQIVISCNGQTTFTIMVTKKDDFRVWIGFDADREAVEIWRQEIYDERQNTKHA